MSQVQPKKTSSNQQAVAKKEQVLPALNVSNYVDNFGDAGFENVTSENLAMPFIKLISDASPENQKNNPKYIEGAASGMIVNTVTKKLYDGAKGILVVPCFYKFEYVEWEPTRSGNAPVATYPADSDILSKTTRNPMDNRDYLPSKNYIEGTNYHFVLLLNEDGTPDTTGLITMSRTQTKKSKKWNSMMKSMPKVKNSQGKYVSQPMFMEKYRLTTAQEGNTKGSWTSWIVNHAGAVDKELTLKTASEFYKTCSKGVVVKHEADDIGTETDNNPF